MKKNILFAILATSCLLTHTACEDGKDEYLSDFSTILYFRNSGELPLTVYKTGENTDYQLIVNKSGSTLGATASIDVGIMSDASLAAYNAAEGVNYKALPGTCYTFSNETIEFGAADLYKTVNVSLIAEQIEQNSGTDATTYVIPFELYNGSDSINAEKRYAFIIPSVQTLTVGFENSGFISTDDITGSEGTTTITQSILMPIVSQWDLDCQVTVDEGILDEYNTANKKNLKMAAEDSYTIEITPFQNGSNHATVTITLDKSKLIWGQQAIPLKISGTSNPNFAVDEAKSSCIVGINYTIPRSELTQIPLSLDMLSSNATVNGDGTGLAGLFDGRGGGLHWHSNYSGSAIDAVYGHYIDFKLSNPINHFAYNFWTRFENANGAPTKTIIYAGNDGNTWKEIGEVANSFTTGNEEYDSNVFSSSESFTYIRFSVTESNAGNVCTGQFWNCGEMQIFGK